jgi:hypothetical protein
MQYVVIAIFIFLYPTVVFGDVSNFVFSTEPQIIKSNEVSKKITIQAQDNEGSPTKLAQTTCLKLNTSSTEGEFSSNDTNWNQIDILTMSKNSINRNFYYKDLADGIYELSAKISFKPQEEKSSCADWLIDNWNINWNIKQNITILSLDNSSLDEDANQTQTNLNNENQQNNFSIEPQIFADAGEDRSVIIGADSLFEGRALGLQKKPLEGARYLWNFGNGEIREGQNVLYYYQYPGEYVVTLYVSSGQYSASDRIIVNAYPTELVISEVNKDFVEIHNKSNKELNLSWWQLQSGGERFMIPKDTIVLPNKKLIFSSSVTGLDTSVKESVSLLYPNGVEAVKFEEIKIPQKTTVVKKNAGEGLSSRNEVERGETLRSVTNLEKELIIEKKEVTDNSSEQTASVISSFKTQENESGIYKWLLAIFSIIAVSGGIIVYASSKKELGDDIEIVE